MNLTLADFKETAAWLKAQRTRRAIDQYLRKNPDAARDHINDRLDVASRLEEKRTIYLFGAL